MPSTRRGRFGRGGARAGGRPDAGVGRPARGSGGRARLSSRCSTCSGTTSPSSSASCTALAAVDVGQGTVARWRDGGRRPGDTGLDPAARRTCRSPRPSPCWLLPLLLSLANALRVRNCNLWAGLGVFRCSCRWRPRSTRRRPGCWRGWPSPRRGRLLAFAVPMVSILWTLRRLYRDPPVFAFDPFGGLLPGADLRRGAAPAGGPGPLPPGERRLDRDRRRDRGGRGRAAGSIPGAGGGGRCSSRCRSGWRRSGSTWRAATWPSTSTAAICVRDARSDPRDRPLRRALRGERGQEPTDLALTGEDLEFRYQQLRDTFGDRAEAADHRSGSSRAPRRRRRWSAPATRSTRAPGRRRSSCTGTASRPGACTTRWRTCSRARSAIRCSASRWPGGCTARCRCRPWRWAWSRGSPRRRRPPIPTATPPSTRRRRR